MLVCLLLNSVSAALKFFVKRKLAKSNTSYIFAKNQNKKNED